MSGSGGPVDGALALAVFVAKLRAGGLPVAGDQVIALGHALEALGPGATPAQLRAAGRAALCSSAADLDRYEALGGPLSAAEVAGPDLDPDPDDDRPVDAGERGADVLDGGTGEGPAASALELLRLRDATTVSEAELDELRRLNRLAHLPERWRRRSRRHRQARSGPVDRRRTSRAVLANGGELLAIEHRRRRHRPRRIVILIDVSGSMEAHADLYLRFAHAAVRSPLPTQVFTIGTRMTPVTGLLDHPHADAVVASLATHVLDRAGGTRLGEGLMQFVQAYGRRGVARGSVVVVLSDGWERGDVDLLDRALAQLSRLAHRTWWASPWAGQPDFAPTTRGLAAAARHCDRILPAGSLSHIEQLIDALVVASADALPS